MEPWEGWNAHCIVSFPQIAWIKLFISANRKSNDQNCSFCKDHLHVLGDEGEVVHDGYNAMEGIVEENVHVETTEVNSLHYVDQFSLYSDDIDDRGRRNGRSDETDP